MRAIPSLERKCSSLPSERLRSRGLSVATESRGARELRGWSGGMATLGILLVTLSGPEGGPAPQ